MLVLRGPIVYCDVDDTLVRWTPIAGEYVVSSFVRLDPLTGEYVYLEFIPETIEALRRHAIRGHKIVVWSAGGAEWAQDVVTMLKLGNIVQACLDKPTWWYDDVPADEILRSHTRRDLSK